MDVDVERPHVVVDAPDLAALIATGRVPPGNWLLYFTTWNALLVAAHAVTARVFDLRLSCWVVASVATWVWYISPGRAIFAGGGSGVDYVLAPGASTRLVDVLVHVVPLFAAYHLGLRPPAPWQALATAGLLASYLAVAPTRRIYGESKDRLMAVGLATCAAYVVASFGRP